LYKGLPLDNEKVSPCVIKIRRAPQVEIKEMGVGTVHIATMSDRVLQWRLQCGKKENITSTTGSSSITVPEGCRLSGSDIAYTLLPSSIDLRTELEQIDFDEKDLESILSYEGWDEVKGMLDDEEISSYVTKARLSDIKLARILQDTQASHRFVGIGSVGTVIVVCVILFLLVGVALCKYSKLRTVVKRTKKIHEPAVSFSKPTETVTSTSTSSASASRPTKTRKPSSKPAVEASASIKQ